MYVVASVTYQVCSHGEHMGISVQRATTTVCLPGTAPIWGGGLERAAVCVCKGKGSSKELSSASVPQDKLQLSPRGHEKQSELSYPPPPPPTPHIPWTYLRL